MSKLTCTRRIQFCAGHRVLNHESKCANSHGHNYVAYFHAEGGLDKLGRVIDFSVLKELLGGWIDRNWDHGFIVYSEDREMISALERLSKQKLYLMPSNPTAENMADFLLRVVCPKVLTNTAVTVTKVVLWETENCFAEASL